MNKNLVHQIKGQIDEMENWLTGKSPRDYLLSKVEREAIFNREVVNSGDGIVLVKVGTHGELHWTDNKCPKCGGKGHGPWHEDGGRCWHCSGTGVAPHGFIQHTNPEYEKFQSTRKELEDAKKRLSYIIRGLTWKGFTEEDPYIYAVAMRDTFAIKGELKSKGAKFCPAGFWYFTSKPADYPVIELGIGECLNGTEWDIIGLKELFKKKIDETCGDVESSEWLGSEGDKVRTTIKILHTYEKFYDVGYTKAGSLVHKIVGETELGQTVMCNGNFGVAGDTITIEGRIKSCWTNDLGKKVTTLSRAKLVA